MIKMANGKMIENYKKLSNRKKNLITKAFCEDFRDNIIKYAKENDKKHNHITDYSNESYISFYCHIESTYLFYDALKDTCIKHNVVKAIYDYAKRMPWYDSDCFDDDLVLRMVELEVIPYTTDEFEDSEEYLLDDFISCDIVTHHKGYSVSIREFWDKDDKKGLEEIYIDCPNVEIIWYE